MAEQQYNDQLNQWANIIPSSEAGQGHIERPGGFDNRVWQTRSRAPEAFELALLDALEAVFEGGATELADIADGLNARQCFDRDGLAWSQDSFLREMAVLGH